MSDTTQSQPSTGVSRLSWDCGIIPRASIIDKKQAKAFECPLCYEISLPIYRVIDCGHAVCKTCYSKMTRRQCPICKEKFRETQTQPCLAMKLACQSLRVKCPGCDEVYPLRDGDKHYETCPYVLENCTHCDTAMPRGYRQSHENACDFRHPTSCPHCEEMVSVKKFAQHCLAEGSDSDNKGQGAGLAPKKKRPCINCVTCDYCGAANVPRFKVLDHFQQCPEFPMVCDMCLNDSLVLRRIVRQTPIPRSQWEQHIREQHNVTRVCKALQQKILGDTRQKPEMRQALLRAVCTIQVTGENYNYKQHEFECLDCGLHDNNDNKFICMSCAIRCHAGHNVAYVGLFDDPGYCDCSEGGKNDRCRCIDKSKIPPKQVAVFSLEEEDEKDNNPTGAVDMLLQAIQMIESSDDDDDTGELPQPQEPQPLNDSDAGELPQPQEPQAFDVMFDDSDTVMESVD